MSDTQNEAEGQEIEIEILDDTPESDRGKVKAPDKTDSDEDISVSDDEVSRYKNDVQKRIKDLSFKAHSERRAKEAAVKEREEAARLAKALMDENRRLRDAQRAQEVALVQQAKGRSESDINLLKRAAKESFEAGDTEKFLELNEKLQRAVVENERYAAWQPPQREPEPEPVVHQFQAAKPDAKAEEWYSRNSEWFQGQGDVEEEMTAYAFGVSDNLLKKGIDPKSDEYYQRIDESVRRRFPDYFRESQPEPEKTATVKASTVVAPVARSVKTTRKVQLSPSQVALCKRLGITPEKYVQHYLQNA